MDEIDGSVSILHGIGIGGIPPVDHQRMFPGAAVIIGEESGHAGAFPVGRGLAAAVIFYQQDIAGVKAAQEKAGRRIGDPGQAGITPGRAAVLRKTFRQKTDTDSSAGKEPQSTIPAFQYHRFVKVSRTTAFGRFAACPGRAVVSGFGVVVVPFAEVVGAEQPATVAEDGRLTAEETGGDEARFRQGKFFCIRIIADGGKGGEVVFIIEGIMKVAPGPEYPHFTGGIEKELDVDTADKLFSQTGNDQERLTPMAAVVIASDQNVIVAQRRFAAAAGVPPGIKSAFRCAQDGGTSLPETFGFIKFTSGRKI